MTEKGTSLRSLPSRGDENASLVLLEAANVLRTQREGSAAARESAKLGHRPSGGKLEEKNGSEETKDDVAAAGDQQQTVVPPSAKPPSMKGGGTDDHLRIEKPEPGRASGVNDGIDARYFKQTLQQIEKGHEVCCSVVYSLLFTVLFVTVVIIHLNPTSTFQVEATLIDEFITTTFDGGNKAYGDINSIATWWQWVDEVVVPKSFKQYDDLGFLLEPPDWSRIATFNKLIAGVRLDTSRANNGSCPNPNLAPLYGNSDCYDPTSTSIKDYGSPPCNYEITDYRACYNSSRYEDIVNTTYNEGFRVLPGRDYFTLFLDKYDKVEITQSRLDYAKERHWLDDATASTKIEILTYSGELDLFSYTVMKQKFERGGAVILTYEISSAFSTPYREWWWYLLDAIFFLSVVYKFVDESRELWPFLKKGDIQGYFSNDDGWWNIVDWAAIVLSFLLLGYWLKYVLLINSVETEFAAIGNQNLAVGERIAANRNFINSKAYQAYVNQLEAAAASLTSAVNTRNVVRSIAAFNAFMTVLRFFKVARFLPRANLLVMTVGIAAVDLVHYAAVFLVVLVAFAIEGWLVFGHRILDFETLWEATQTSMLIVMNAVDTTALYADMYTISPTITVIWYWSFFFVVILLVMNLFIAIIIDAYAAARGSLKDRDTLWGEVVHARRILTLYWRPGYLRPRDLLRCFEPGGSLHGEELITPDLLVQKVEAPSSMLYWHRRLAGPRKCGCCPGRSAIGSVSGSGRKARVNGGGGGGDGIRSRASIADAAGVDIEAAIAPAYGSEGAPGTQKGSPSGSSSSHKTQARRRLFKRPRQRQESEPEMEPPQACEAREQPEQTVYLNRRYAEHLVADALDDKVDGDEAHGVSLSSAAKEIADALIYVRLMGDRFSSMEECLEDFLNRQAVLTGDDSKAGTPMRYRLTARDVPDPPLTRLARHRLSLMVADGNVDATVAAEAVAAAAAGGEQC